MFISLLCSLHYSTTHIRTDRGGEFLNDIVKKMQENYHFEHMNSSSRHPQGDGQIEIRNKEEIGMLSINWKRWTSKIGI
jgi:hypothetical protein